MKDPLNQMLQLYQVPHPKENEIVRTILSGQRELEKAVRARTPLRRLVGDQLRYVSPLLWATQLLAIVLTVFLSARLTGHDSEVQQIFFTVTPLLTLCAVPELIKSVAYDMAEVENVCRNSVPRILLARLLIVGGMNVVAISAVAATISVRSGLPFRQIILYGLVPFNAITGLNLVIADCYKVRSSFAAIAVSLCTAVLVRGVITATFVEQLGRPAWFILCCVTAAFMLGELYRFMRTQAGKERSIQWN